MKQAENLKSCKINVEGWPILIKIHNTLYILGNTIEPFPENSENFENYSKRGLRIKFWYLDGQLNDFLEDS